jgi:hypothetical protein
MPKFHSLPLVVLLAGIPALAAEAAAVSGPVLGYVFDGPGALRPILGVPGASFLGARVPFGFDSAMGEISPRQDYAMIVGTDGALRLLDLGRAPVSARAIDGALASPDRMLLSPAGRSALLVKGTGAQVITGLPAKPAVAGIDFSALPGMPEALAVNDDGAVLAAAAGGLFLVTGSVETRALPSSGEISALAFAPNGTDALAAGAGQVAVIADVAGQPAWRTVATLDGDSGTPFAAAATERRALIATSASLIAVDLQTGAATPLECATPVTALARLGGEAFRLGALTEDPLWIVDGGPQPRLLFVPPVPASGEVTR